MKKIGLLITMMVGAFLMLTTNVTAQTNAGEAVTYSVPEIAMIAIHTSGVNLAFAAPATAGLAVVNATGNGGWVNYTSVITSTLTNKITAEVSVADLAKLTALGTELTITAATNAATGKDGDTGTGGTAVVLSIAAQPLIATIGSCYTGVGGDKGHELSYVWSITDYTAFEYELEISDITVALTIVATV